MTTPTKTAPNLLEARNTIFGNATPKSKVIEFFGTSIELRQPTLQSTLEKEANQAKGQHAQTALMIINYAYIPGTDEKVFTDADVDKILSMPWGKDFNLAIEVIGEMTSIDDEVKEAEKN